MHSRQQEQRHPAERKQYKRDQYAIAVYGYAIGADPLKYKKDRHRVAREQGYRSGLEVKIAEGLRLRGVDGHYEELCLPFTQPEKPRRYHPDYWLPTGIVVETKGRFETADRSKHLMVKEQHPEIEIRFVFSRSKSTISKKSKTTYADWCKSHGFKFADKDIPDAWLKEPVNKKSLAAIRVLLKNA